MNTYRYANLNKEYNLLPIRLMEILKKDNSQ